MWLLAACVAPYPDPSAAPGGRAPWSYPTDDVCAERADPDAFEVDGFLFCAGAAEEKIVAVDDPVLVPCADVPREQEGLVFSVFDGARAQAFPLALLAGREIVHVNWDGDPLLVDF